MVDSARKNYSKKPSKTKQHSTKQTTQNFQKTHQNEMIPNRQKCSDILYSHFLHQKKKFLLPKREAKIKEKKFNASVYSLHTTTTTAKTRQNAFHFHFHLKNHIHFHL